MLDPQIVSTTRELTRVDFADRDSGLARQVGDVRSRSIQAGGSGGSREIISIAQVYEQELRVRAAIALNTLRRSCSSVGLNPESSLSEDLANLLLDIISAEATKLGEQLRDTARRSSQRSRTQGSSLEPNIENSFNDVRDNEFAKARNEAILLAANVRASARVSGAAGGGGGDVTVVGTEVLPGNRTVT